MASLALVCDARSSLALLAQLAHTFNKRMLGLDKAIRLSESNNAGVSIHSNEQVSKNRGGEYQQLVDDDKDIDADDPLLIVPALEGALQSFEDGLEELQQQLFTSHYHNMSLSLTDDISRQEWRQGEAVFRRGKRTSYALLCSCVWSVKWVHEAHIQCWGRCGGGMEGGASEIQPSRSSSHSFIVASIGIQIVHMLINSVTEIYSTFPPSLPPSHTSHWRTDVSTAICTCIYLLRWMQSNGYLNTEHFYYTYKWVGEDRRRWSDEMWRWAIQKLEVGGSGGGREGW